MGVDWYYCPICGEMIIRNWGDCKHMDDYWKYVNKEDTNDKTFNEFCKSEYNYKTFIPLTDEEKEVINSYAYSYLLNGLFHQYRTFDDLNEILFNFRSYGTNDANKMN